MAKSKIVGPRCPRHKNYKIVDPPLKNDCFYCWSLWVRELPQAKA